MNVPAAVAALENPRSLTGWTERSGVKAVWIVLHYGPDLSAEASAKEEARV